MSPERRTALLRLLAFLLVAAVMVAIFLMRDHIQDLAHYGYAGVFIVTALANATVFLPVPGVAFVFGMGAVFNPLIVAVFAGLGAATGEISGYLLGYSGQGLIERSDRYRRLLDWMDTHRRYADLLIFVFAAIPNPFFDLAGIAAGTLKLPLWRFFIFAAAGSILKMLIFAFTGRTGLNWLFGSF